MTNDKVKSRKPIVCFIDDDKNELERFQAAMEQDFICIIGDGYSDIIQQLQERKLKPDLWVLDLFFPIGGHVNTSEELSEMNDRYAVLEKAVQDFRAFLKNIRQGPEGGIELLKTCLKNHKAPVVMFTRKGTLDDAIQCRDEGAISVLKKPMPGYWPDSEKEKKKMMDEAIIQNRAYLRDKFHTAISSNTFLNKHKLLIGLLGGALLSGLIGALFTLSFRI